MKSLFSSFVADEIHCNRNRIRLIAAGISVAIIAVVQGLGTELNTTFTAVTTALSTATKYPAHASKGAPSYFGAYFAGVTAAARST